MKAKNNPAVFQYMNRLRNVFYLHQRFSPKGSACYYFSKKIKKNFIEKIPDGYEIREHPETAQVFLQKKLASVITKIEEDYINQAMERLSPVKYFKMDIKKNKIVIYMGANVPQLTELLSELAKGTDISSKIDLHALASQVSNYKAMVQFTLTNEEKRYFVAERKYSEYCEDDEWITIFSFLFSPLEKLCEVIFPHFGKNSFYGL